MSLVFNKKASFEYTLGKKFTAGVVLTGPEVKSLRLQHASLNGSYIKTIGNELFLINAQINPYQFAQQEKYDPKQSRKLLVTKKELQEIQEALTQKGLSIVPLAFFIAHNHIKLEFALARGKKEYEKRETIKNRDLQRRLDRIKKNYA